MARILYNGYGLTEMRRYAKEYKIPGRSKMDGPALLAALCEYWDNRRKEQEQALLASVKVQPGTLLRHKSSGTVIRVTSTVGIFESYGALYVHAEYVSLGESDTKNYPAGVGYLNRNGATHRHMLYQYEAIETPETVDIEEPPVDWRGRKFGQLTKDEQRRVTREAAGKLQAELEAMAPYITADLEVTP